MSTTNEIWLPVNGHLVRLDLDDDTALLPSFQANDRTDPSTIQSVYSVEFDVPGNNHNHALLGQAATSQLATSKAYVELPCVLTSGGVEILPLGILYIKGYRLGRIVLQLFGGNLRFTDRLKNAQGEDKKLSDLDFNRFNHYWLASTVEAGLSYAHWETNHWGYELYDRGKKLDLQAINPFECYPGVAGSMVFRQIVQEAGFTSDDLLSEALFARLNLPTTNPYTFDQDFRDARHLLAGWRYQDGQMFRRRAEFAPVVFDYNFTSDAPYTAPTAAGYVSDHYQVTTLGYYDLRASLECVLSCAPSPAAGEVSMKVALLVNGAEVGTPGYLRVGHFTEATLTAKAERLLLKPGDQIHVTLQGDEWPTAGFGPYETFFQAGRSRALVALSDGTIVELGPPYDPAKYHLESSNVFEVVLREEFPEGGLVRLQDWLPDMTQLEYIKAVMLLLGLTIQADNYRPHLRLAPGTRLLQNIGMARNWEAKRDAAAARNRLPERDLAFRFGDYGQTNFLRYKADANVTPGYGDGRIAVADQVLPPLYEMAVLPFAATEPSRKVAGLLQILNFEAKDINNPDTYSALKAEPRVVLRTGAPALPIKLVAVPKRVAGSTVDGVHYPVEVAAVLHELTIAPAYFAGTGPNLLLNSTVLSSYWADLRAMLDSARAVTELLRLTPVDIAELDFSVPVWLMGDYWAVSSVNEYDARRSVEVHLVRLNAAHLPGPNVPGEGAEFFRAEFQPIEFY